MTGAKNIIPIGGAPAMTNMGMVDYCTGKAPLRQLVYH